MSNELIGSSKRIPLLFCVDTSDSMRGLIDITDIKKLGVFETIEGERRELAEGGTTYLEEVKKQLLSFVQMMACNIKVKYSADVSLVTFANETVEEIPFSKLEDFSLKGKLNDPNGKSLFCSTFSYCLTTLERRIKEYNDHQIAHYPARIIIFTDGKITDERMLPELKNKITAFLNKEELFVFIVSLDTEDVYLKKIQEATDSTIINFDKNSISNFFSFLKNSISTKPNEKGQQRPKDIVRMESRIR